MKWRKLLSAFLAVVLVVSGAFSVTVSAVSAPSITKQPVAQSVVAGNTASFTVTASGTGLTYQWQCSKDSGSTWSNCKSTGYDTKTFSFKTTASYDGWRYRCVVKNSGGSVTSSAAKLSVLGIKTQPKAQNVVAGSTAKFTVDASGSSLTYQWQYSTDGGSTWTNCKSTGYNKATFSFSASASLSGRKYRCVVKNNAGSVTSSAVKLSVLGITAQPKAQSVKAGETAKFTVTATGTSLTYQWQCSKNGGSTWTNCKSTGYNTKTFSFSASASYDGWKYRCVITNSAGSVTSSAAKLTVLSKPKITAQPKNAAIGIGDSYTFKVTATGGNLTYQWQYSKDGGSTWVNWSGKTSASLSIKGSLTNDGNLYRCIVKNSLGTVTSNAASLSVAKISLTVNCPIDLYYYGWDGDLEEAIEISDVTFTYYESSNYAKVFPAGFKWYDSEGDYNSESFVYDWVLYNSDGLVIDTGSGITNSIAVGDSFVDTIYLWDLAPGRYTLEFVND